MNDSPPSRSEAEDPCRSEPVTKFDRALWRWSLAFLALVVLGSVAAVFHSGPFLWGIDAFAFLPGAATLLLLLSWAASSLALFRFPDLARRLNDGPQDGRGIWIPGLLVPAFSIIAVLFWAMRTKTHFLGDGIYVINSLSRVSGAVDVHEAFGNEFLVGYIYWSIGAGCALLGWDPGPELIVRSVSIGAGLIAVAAVCLLARSLFNRSDERTLFAAFIAGYGGVAHFFGYVENYALLIAGLLVLFYLIDRSLAGTVHPLVVGSISGVIVCLHAGTIIMAPAFALYMVFMHRRDPVPRHLILAWLSPVIVALSIFLLCGGTAGMLKAKFEAPGGDHFLGVFRAEGLWEAYTLFSPAHALELLNLVGLLSPFAPLLLAAGLFRRTSISATEIMLLALSCCGCAFTFLVVPKLGMGRDWDLFAGYFLPVAVAGAVLFLRNGAYGFGLRRRILALFASASIIHAAAGVVVNADETASVARFAQMIGNPSWGTQSRAYGNEVLSTYFAGKGRGTEAIEYSRRAIEANPSFGRLWMGLGELYRHQGMTDSAISAYERLLSLDSTSIETLVTLSDLYAGQAGGGRRALELLAKALRLDSTDARLHNNFGGMLLAEPGGGGPAKALPSFRRAVSLDSTNVFGSYNAGMCEYLLGDFEAAEGHFRRYLRLTGDPSRERSLKEEYPEIEW